MPQKELVPHSAPQCLKKVWGTIGRPNLRLLPIFVVLGPDPFQIVASIREVTDLRFYCRLERSIEAKRTTRVVLFVRYL